MTQNQYLYTFGLTVDKHYPGVINLENLVYQSGANQSSGRVAKARSAKAGINPATTLFFDNLRQIVLFRHATGPVNTCWFVLYPWRYSVSTNVGAEFSPARIPASILDLAGINPATTLVFDNQRQIMLFRHATGPVNTCWFVLYLWRYSLSTNVGAGFSPARNRDG
jgi:hypothetical protein